LTFKKNHTTLLKVSITGQFWTFPRKPKRPDLTCRVCHSMEGRAFESQGQPITCSIICLREIPLTRTLDWTHIECSRECGSLRVECEAFGPQARAHKLLFQ